MAILDFENQLSLDSQNQELNANNNGRDLSKYCSNCGAFLNNGAKFCTDCGIQQSNNIKLNSVVEAQDNKRKSTYDGVIHKCPNCGETLKSFQAFCSSCNYELRDLRVSSAIQEFKNKLLQASNKEEKIYMIKTAEISNSREDIFEFMMLAISNFDASFYISHLKEDSESAGWLSIIEQCYQKGKLSLPKEDFDILERKYLSIKDKIKNSQTKNMCKKIISIALIVVGILLVLTEIIALAVIGITLSIVGVVILSTNKKKDESSSSKHFKNNMEETTTIKTGFASWSTTKKVLWIILNIYTLGIPALIYTYKNKDK